MLELVKPTDLIREMKGQLSSKLTNLSFNLHLEEDTETEYCLSVLSSSVFLIDLKMFHTD